MRMMGSITRKLRKASKEGFIFEGYTRAPRFRGQKMVDITNRNHRRVTIGVSSWRNKYRSDVWHDANPGYGGCGCKTASKRFRY